MSIDISAIREEGFRIAGRCGKTHSLILTCTAGTGSPNIRIHGEADGAYRVSANYLVLHTTEEGETRIYSTGTYQDEIVFTETGPKFLKKIVIADTSAIDNLREVLL